MNDMEKGYLVAAIAVAAVAIGVYTALFFPGDILGTPASVSSAVVATAQPSPVAVPFKEIAHGQKSTVTTRVNYLIASTDDLKKLWKMVDATGTPPTIDFASHVVMAVFAGQEPTTGYAIAVSKVTDAATRMVSVTISKPGTNCVSAQMVTTPYQLISVPITTLPLAHEDATTTVACK